MPEFPEVHTTVRGLNETVKNLTIKSVWSDYPLLKHKDKKHIKDVSYFNNFKKEIVGSKIINAHQIGKNILVNLSNKKSIHIHMKMTGHLMYGKFSQKIVAGKSTWLATEKGPLQDPYNRFVRIAFELSNGRCLVMSDTRRFAKVALLDSENIKTSPDFEKLGIGPLDEDWNIKNFALAINKKPHWDIKRTILDQEVICGVGNIYSDEALFESSIRPDRKTNTLSKTEISKLFAGINKVITDGIKAGGDSMSDYRNIHGEKGAYQNSHKAYRRTGEVCPRPRCGGIIERKKIAGRSAHFCPKHQK